MTRQPEGRLVSKIKAHVDHRGGRAFKIHGGGSDEATYQEAGIPDLLICYRGRFIGLEVKQPGEKPSKLQEYVLGEIEAAGGYTAVVTTVKEAADLLAEIDKEVDRAVRNRVRGTGARHPRHRNSS